ncbi:extracellular solute-binding protein [Aeromonas hydrophila]|uniref:Extracellular solute-binding protein n=1 Tax=Aeromonas hydrophila TaxID=644 RepID=A0A926FNX0_AERHY|nr:extracellular solute-binding protein [Aeromonas hydrophila]
MPDIVTIQNGDAESFWSQFPDCFTDLKALGYTPEVQAKFPQFKRTELEVGDKAYAMPWDTGPVVMFYRRDLYEKAGVDPATIVTWDDFIAAGKKISEANPGVVMSQADLNGDDEFMRMIGNEQGCNYFSDDGGEITINQPACVSTLDTIKSSRILEPSLPQNGMRKSSRSSPAKWPQMYGGWYEGTLRTNAPDLAGKWGVYAMPSVTADGLHAANVGGSALGITSISANKEAAYAYLNYAWHQRRADLHAQGLWACAFVDLGPRRSLCAREAALLG